MSSFLYDDNCTMPTDMTGAELSGKAVQAWYNPVDIDPIVGKDNKDKRSWTDYFDVNFDWIWGVPTGKKAVSAVQTAGSNVISGIKKTGYGILILTALVTAIVVVPRVLPIK